MNYLKLCKEKLDVGAINDLVVDSSCGAVSMFIGTTRDNFENKKVICLEYEAYEPMALKTMNKICEDIRSKWSDIKHVAIYHRLGIVPVKEASVVIAVSSPHRQTSLLSVQFAIDELKKTVPIWKKEQYEGDDAIWKENKECPASKRFKRPKVNLDACALDKVCVPKTLVQIAADENEISRRIQCFIEKKREEIDINNVLDFTNSKPENVNPEETCARVNSIVIKQKDSKGHLKVQRVKNEVGPQVKTDYTNALDKLMSDSNQTSLTLTINQEPGETPATSVPFGVVERLGNVEKYLNISTNSSKHIYERIKAIEDRILFLEAISPEYRHFLNPQASNAVKVYKKTYTVEDLDNYIERLRESISKDEIT